MKEYRYPPHRARTARFQADSIGALVIAYKASPEWRAKAPATQAMYGLYFRELEKKPNTPVAGVTRREMIEIRNAIAEIRGHGAATGFVRAASVLFEWAADNDWIEHSPMERVKALPGGNLPTWTPQHVALALKGLPEHLRRVVALAAATGQRRGDLVAMRWSDYDGTAIRIKQQKTGVSLVLPVAKAMRAELDAWRCGASDGTILRNGMGRPWVAQRLTEMLKRAMAKIEGLPPGLGIHGVRKFKATDLANRGATAHQIAAVTGHKTLAMVQLYTDTANQEHLADQALSLPQKRGATRSQKTVVKQL